MANFCWAFSVIALLVFKCSLAQEVGDACDHAMGLCTLITNCRAALIGIESTGFHKLKRCGFAGSMEIVCCPISDSGRAPLPASVALTEPIPTQQFVNPQPATIRPPSLTTKRPLRRSDIECIKLAQTAPPPVASYILGGENVTLGEFPHMVAIGYPGEENTTRFLCGGSLISPWYVLTAAHCLSFSSRAELPTTVRVGVVYLGDTSWDTATDYRVEQVLVHPSHSTSVKYHDVGLIKLDRAVPITENAHPACLYTSLEDPKQPLTVTGWGTTKFGSGVLSESLLKANLTLVSREVCNSSYPLNRRTLHGITDDQICAKDPAGNKDTCQGDSGGPLQALTELDGHYRIVGITSFGIGCATNYPGVYSKVSHYVDWIETVVWPESRR